jgi:hypothetical protein
MTTVVMTHAHSKIPQSFAQCVDTSLSLLDNALRCGRSRA